MTQPILQGCACAGLHAAMGMLPLQGEATSLHLTMCTAQAWLLQYLGRCPGNICLLGLILRGKMHMTSSSASGRGPPFTAILLAAGRDHCCRWRRLCCSCGPGWTAGQCQTPAPGRLAVTTSCLGFLPIPALDQQHCSSIFLQHCQMVPSLPLQPDASPCTPMQAPQTRLGCST